MAVKINAFLTPPTQNGFPWHYDGRDIFVLQVSGDKKWEYAPASIANPIEGSPCEPGHPIKMITLKPGDLFYLPAGWPHRATANEKPSLHLTVNLLAIRSVDVLKESLDILALKSAALRADWRVDIPDDASRMHDDVADEHRSGEMLLAAYRSLQHAWVCDLPSVGRIRDRKSIPPLMHVRLRQQGGLLCYSTIEDGYARLSIGGIGRVRGKPVTMRLSTSDLKVARKLLRLTKPFTVANEFLEPGVAADIASDLMAFGVLMEDDQKIA